MPPPVRIRNRPSVSDPTRASIAGVYDAALGGKDNYEIDREVVHRFQQIAPEAYQFA